LIDTSPTNLRGNGPAGPSSTVSWPKLIRRHGTMHAEVAVRQPDRAHLAVVEARRDSSGSERNPSAVS
jgi:hypothetical protein